MRSTPENALANAIIVQAVIDYLEAKKGFRVDRRDPDVTIRECELFFHSDWFMVLTDMDPDLLMEKLEKEVQKQSQQSYQES